MKNATAHIALWLLVTYSLTIGVNQVLATNSLIDGAVGNGISSETIALLLLLPVIATLISVMHYVVGVSGYGIFMPTMMAVVLMSVGVSGGLVLFGTILGISVLSSLVLKKLKLHFWPARSMGLMMISVVVFCLMVISGYFKVFDIRNISIYPVLFMILLAEEFVRTQLAKSKREAVSLTVGTLILAIVGAMILKANGVQQLALENPVVTILIVVVVNVLVGNYKGIRLTEIKRFKNAIRTKK